MELRQVRYFEAVGRHLSFTRAAQELFISQPALSIQIQQLEAELGSPLFDRTTRAVRLTEAGRTMQQFANRILPEFDEAARRIRDLAGGVQGRIEVAAQQSITSCGALPALLSEFQHAYPDVDVVLREESAGAAATLLRERRIDVALAQRADGNDADDLEIHDLYDEELVLGVAVDHPLLARARSWSDLADTVFIAFNESAALRTTLVTTCRSAGFEPRIGYESTALGSVRALASSGLGVALLPEPALAVAGPPVAVLRLGKTLRRTISILRVTSRYHSAASHAFTRLARERLAALVPTPVR